MISALLQQIGVYEQLSHPNHPASVYIDDVRLQKDIWNIKQDLPLLAEDAQIIGRKSINFQLISLPWLRDLTKLAILIAVANRRWCLHRVQCVLSSTSNFNTWLLEQGYVTSSMLAAQVVQQWAQNRTYSQATGLQGLLRLLKELGCIQFHMESLPRDNQLKRPKTIPEEVKYNIDLAIEQLDRPIYLAFKLHATLGTRSSEIAKIPLDCLKLREGVSRIRLCTGKQDDIKQEQDLPTELMPLVQQQQAFVREKFGEKFPWLFPKWIAIRSGFSAQGWPPVFEYYPEQIKQVTKKLNLLLRRLIEENNIFTNDGSLAYVTTHMFRRTYATVADRMGKRPDVIQHGLRHTNLDMQDSYIYVAPQQQEKRIHRVLVDKDGKRTVYRTDQDSEFLRREWTARQVELGICTRPSIVKNCEFEYVCLGCEYVRFAQEHLDYLMELRETNHNLLELGLKAGQSDSRRANSARQFISVLNPIIANLQKATDQEVSS